MAPSPSAPPSSSVSYIVINALTGYPLPRQRLTLFLAVVGGGIVSLSPLTLGARTPAEAAAFAVLLLLVAAADLGLRIVPNRLLVLGSAVALVAGIATGDLLPRLLGAAAAITALLFVRVVGHFGWGRSGMGMGDVKLGGVMGLFLSWNALWALYLAILLGGLYGAGALASRPRLRGAALPFAPFLAAGTLLAGDVLPLDRFMDWIVP